MGQSTGGGDDRTPGEDYRAAAGDNQGFVTAGITNCDLPRSTNGRRSEH